MVKRFKKYESGESTQYMTRVQALRKLQLSLNDFRRICILKGIYPREPKNRRRAQKGNTSIKILYHRKDITFLLHEPLVLTLREIKIFNRRIRYAQCIKDKKLKKLRLENYPIMKLDNVIKERYPTFIDAIKDLDDCLTLLFLFSTFPALKTVPRRETAMCRRLSVEFMHAIISARALRKCFISIKGYYFQAEVKGQTITWIVPHYYPYQPQERNEVDFKIMTLFVEFYTTVAGFVNFRLYHSLNLVYPPQFSISLDSDASLVDESVFVSERIAALNSDLVKADPDIAEQDDLDDDFDVFSNEGDSHKVQKMRKEALSLKKLKNLFKGLKFFINREVPREPLVFIIRCFGGKVSWDKNIFVGSTFDETDETITHQIVDRPKMDQQYISRDYIQPQWLFDCVNQRQLLPTNNYFIGAILPPHLSPFTDSRLGDDSNYIPPEEKALRDPKLVETYQPSDDEISDIEEENEANKATEVELDYALEMAYKDELEDDTGETEDKIVDKESEDEDASEEEAPATDEKTKKRLQEKKKMGVKTGQLHKENIKEANKSNKQEDQLLAKMVKSKHKKLYHNLVNKRQAVTKEAKLLESKRRRIDADAKKERKNKRKDERKQFLTSPAAGSKKKAVK